MRYLTRYRAIKIINRSTAPILIKILCAAADCNCSENSVTKTQHFKIQGG